MSTDLQESLNEELLEEAADTESTDGESELFADADDAAKDGGTVVFEPHEAEHYAAIRECSQDVERLAMKMEEAKEKASAAKKAYDAEVSELRSLIRRGPDPQGKLPLVGADKDSAVATEAEPSDDADDPEPDDNWRDTPIGHLNAFCGMPPRFLKPLEEAKLTTLGKLSDAMNEGGDTWHYDLDGIGDKAAEHIADAFTEFWEDRNIESDD